jgi:hypothetical protein
VTIAIEVLHWPDRHAGADRRANRRRRQGIDLILGGFMHCQEEIEYFGSRVSPLVREIEGAEADSVGDPALA